MRPLTHPFLVLLAFAAVSGAALGAAEAPLGVSPGGAERFEPAAACPTFSWTAVPGAEGYELVVYRALDAGTEPALRATLPAGASSWTPAIDRCLAGGERYAWSVRARTATARVGGGWSEALLFTVAEAPFDLSSALEVLSRHLGPDAVAAALAAAGSSREASLSAAGHADAQSAEDQEDLLPTQNSSDAAEQGAGIPIVAVRGEVPDVTGETYGAEGVAHSPDGAGVRAENTDAAGADLLLAGSPPAELTESALSRGSASNLTFDFTNPGAGTMTLQQDGVAVATDASIFPTVLANDGSGSTLDADLLDGLDSTAFLPGGTDDWVNETGDAMTGTLAIDVAAGNALSTAAGDPIDLGGDVLKSGVLFLHNQGTQSTALGSNALAANTGTGNTAVGSSALQTNTTGYRNAALGTDALRANTTGTRNVAVGERALYANTTGTRNVAVGHRTLPVNTTGIRNVAIGNAALYANTTGARNTVVGNAAMLYNTTGSRNTALGVYALNENTTGNNNTAVGGGALLLNDTGLTNTAVGVYALAYNSTGGGNAAVGLNALYSNVDGNMNVALGRNALFANTSGSANIALGVRAGYDATGSNNIDIGNEGVAGENGVIRIGTAGTHGIAYLAGVTGVAPSGGGNLPVVISATGQLGTASGGGSGIDADLLDGIDSTGFMPAGTDLWVDAGGDTMSGPLSLGGNDLTSVGNVELNTASTVTKDGGRFLWDDAGNQSLALGRGALASNTTGDTNTAIGTGAMGDNATGQANTAIGWRALDANSDGSRNTAVGRQALASSGGASDNTAVGFQALRDNDSGINNTAVGGEALAANTTGPWNAALGRAALAANTTGYYNTAVGGRALDANTTGNENTAVGEEALTNSTASRNTAVGQATMLSNTTGTDNTAVGHRALYSNSTGTTNIAIGNLAGFDVTGSHNISIANSGAAGENGAIRIGTAGNQTTAFISGIHSVTPGGSTPLPVIVDANGQLGTTDLLLLTPRAGAPTCGSGTIYYDSDDETFCFCEAGTWQPRDGVGACT